MMRRAMLTESTAEGTARDVWVFMLLVLHRLEDLPKLHGTISANAYG
jgi:hypothetical protein